MPNDVGPYEILDPIGRGGMGVVHRARHREHGEVVALKTLHQSTAARLAAMEQEIAALAALRHPGVVHIVDWDLNPEQPWVAMSLVAGRSLREVWNDRRAPVPTGTVSESTWSTAALPVHRDEPARLVPSAGPAPASDWRPAARVLSRLCDALAHVHEIGLVHADLKPSNVIVDLQGRPVLVDFGLTTRVGGRELPAAVNMSARTHGTALYIAPEVVRGHPPDARADLYALGCMLYEAICGAPPFTASTTGAVLLKHASVPAPAPSASIAGLPPALDELVLALLAKAPRDRLSHTTLVQQRLAHILGDEPTQRAMSPVIFRPGLVGRQTQIDALETHLGSLSPQQGGFELFIGGQGSGKTRLLMEGTRLARSRGIEVVVSALGTLHGEVGSYLSALDGALDFAADRCLAHGPDETAFLFGPRLRTIGAFVPGLHRLHGYDDQPDPSALPQRETRTRLVDAALETLTALCTRRPLVLLLDDLHWADPCTIEVCVQHANNPVPGLLILAACRTDDRNHRLARLFAMPEVAPIKVAPLSADNLRHVVAEMLGVRTAPEDLAEFALSASGGNLFMLCEAVRTSVAARAVIRAPDGSWQMFGLEHLGRKGPDLTCRRVERLGPEVLQVARAAAVLDGPLRPSIVAAVTGFGRHSVGRDLYALVSAGILTDAGNGALRFLHRSQLEAVLSEMPPDLRCALHGKAATALADEIDRIPYRVAVHHREAGQPERAAPLFLASARQAAKRNEPEEVIRGYRAHLQLVPSDAHALRAIVALAADGYYAGAQIAEALACYEQTAELATRLGVKETNVRARLSIGACLLMLGRLPEAKVALKTAEKMLPDLQGARGLWLMHKVTLAARQGRVEEAVALGEQAIASSTTAANRANAARTLADCLRQQGRLQEALDWATKAVSLLEQTDKRRLLAIALSTMGNLRADTGSYKVSEGYTRRAYRIAFEIGDTRWQALCLGNLAGAAYRAGRYKEAAATIEATIGVLERLGDRRSVACHLVNLADTREQLGDPVLARATYLRAVETHELYGEFGHLPDALFGLARLARQGGRLAEAEEWLEKGLAAARQTNSVIEEAVGRCEQLHLTLARGEDPGDLLHRAEQAFISEGAAEGQGASHLKKARRAVACWERGEALDHGDATDPPKTAS